MPANLTPQYQKAEDAYRRAQSPEEQVACLEQMLKLIPKHKGTEKLQADLKTRLKAARSEHDAEASAPKKGRSYRVPRQGAGQVLLIGAPNAGKSRILAELTNATPEVAPYPFTTREPLPAMMRREDVQVQLVDTPPITAAHFEPYLTGFVRTADAVILAFDGSSDDAPDQTAEVIAELAKRKTFLADCSGFVDDDFSSIRVKTLLAVTRSDDPGANDRLAYFAELVPIRFRTVRVEFGENSSPDAGASRENLRERIYDELDVIRLYTKKPGRPADTADPFTIPKDGTVEDLAMKVHREIADKLKFARIWGTSARDGQSVGREHILCDKDIVELHW
ncbi:MAG: GTPase [Planctomycetaceae bacterium]